MRDRSKFKCMMTWTHVVAAVFKAFFSRYLPPLHIKIV
ncbi:vesicular inhibitory amino acid transporter [Biomphalaria pfeifferi]|uniref:Vesicular inhibitory amino acid transporter n=1 Tax=Biomphalaria pfeifferi TaxID=112525 RepID=A0AAD8CCD3_BIOPF|nr:vesicular inhibitory amino acid transporter [Biomphalaria pfeifferi]